jgi:AAA domain
MMKRPERSASEADDFMEDMGSYPSMAEIEETSVKWLWQDVIPFGKLTIIDGDPSQGKSQIVTDIAARTSAGLPMPLDADDGEYELIKLPVSMLCGEDDLSDTVVPRLRVAGADLSGIFYETAKQDEKGNVIPLTMPDGMKRIRRLVKKTGSMMLGIDPITAFLSENILSGNDASVRRALGPLKDLAAETGCAVVLVRHLNKSGDGKAMYRGGGSIAFTGLARSGLITGKLPDEMGGTFAVAQVKSNLAKLLDGAMTYSIVQREQDGSGGWITGIEWHGWADITADDLAKGPSGPKGPAPDKRDACVADVLALLAERDPYDSTELFAELRARGHREGTIKNARAECKKNHEVRSYAIFSRGRATQWKVTVKPMPKDVRGRRNTRS